MTEITYIEGDATTPRGNDNKVIAHICNDSGKWGKGFVMALSRRWREPEEKYRAWYKDRGHLSSGWKLGAVMFVEVNGSRGPLYDKCWVANMIAQHGIKSWDNQTPIRYGALSVALQAVAEFAKKNDASVHMPKIGSGLAGGDWMTIERLITEALIEQGIAVTVYTF